MNDRDPSIVFGGTGTLLMSSLGMAKYLRQYLGRRVAAQQVLTISGGSIGAVALLTRKTDQEFDELAEQLARIFHPLSESNIANLQVGGNYQQALEVVVREEDVEVLSEQLQIAVTRLPLLSGYVYKGPYKSIGEIVGNLQASAYIPGYFTRCPYYNHLTEIDGGVAVKLESYPNALKITTGKGDDSDVWLTEESIPSLKFRSYDEHMTFYRRGYEQAVKLRENVKKKV